MRSEEERARRAAEEEAERRARARAEGVPRLLRTLADLQQMVREELAAAPSEFDAARLPLLLREIERQVARFGEAAQSAAAPVWKEAFELGPRIVEVPLAEAGVRLGNVTLPDSLLDTLTEYAADKIGGIELAAREAIEEHVRLGVLGGQSSHQVMVGIGEELEGPGPFKTVRFRAETVMRTETGRIHSMAAEARLETAAAEVPGLGGEWLWSGKSRATHRAANGQTRLQGEPFLVGGERMRYPRDPEASAANVVLCGCEKIPWLARWGARGG
jgi:hypothetical protein